MLRAFLKLLHRSVCVAVLRALLDLRHFRLDGAVVVVVDPVLQNEVAVIKVPNKGAQEEVFEGVPELLTHDAVEQEVYGTVDEDQQVHHVTKVRVHLVKKRLVKPADPRQDALRELGHHEEENHHHQHHGGAVVLGRHFLVVATVGLGQ